MEWHQKNAGGNARIAETMLRYFRFPAGLRELHLPQPDPARPGDQDRRGILALAEAALHGHALLAAQRHLAGRVMVEPRPWRRLEGAALHGQALLLTCRGLHRSRQEVGPRGDRGGQRRQCGYGRRGAVARRRAGRPGAAAAVVFGRRHAGPGDDPWRRRVRRDRRGQLPVPRLEGVERVSRAQPFLAIALQGAPARSRRRQAEHRARGRRDPAVAHRSKACLPCGGRDAERRAFQRQRL